MILGLFYLTFVTTFVGLVVLEHILLISAIYKCLRDDWAAGRSFDLKPRLSDLASQVAVKVASQNSDSDNVIVFGRAPNPSIANR